MWIISVPTRVKVTKKKYFTINLNQYRNAHFFTLNKAKQVFKEMVIGDISKLPRMNKCELGYKVYPRTRHKSDIANICSIADKFFCDAMIEAGVLVDDNYEHIKDVSYSFGSVDKENPRIDVYIKSLDN